jgi:hypothetical protein
MIGHRVHHRTTMMRPQAESAEHKVHMLSCRLHELACVQALLTTIVTTHALQLLLVSSLTDGVKQSRCSGLCMRICSSQEPLASAATANQATSIAIGSVQQRAPSSLHRLCNKLADITTLAANTTNPNSAASMAVRGEPQVMHTNQQSTDLQIVSKYGAYV